MANEIPTNETLDVKITYMTKAMEDGFKGIHLRQDVTNGKVVKSEEFRIRAEASLAIFKWLFGFLGIGNLVLFGKMILDLMKIGQ